MRLSDIPAGLFLENARTNMQTALDDFNAKHIELTTARRNTRSIKVAERCGFIREAVLSNTRIDKAGVVDDTACMCSQAPYLDKGFH
ncbi:GNAT family N-acetyltransferase [Pseudomonas tolaasii]|uniref:GNAT family N-acetyltransferase n=1 Tax=Pseudomonas tolaasii TaxID=29442 RepID=UPI0015A3BCC5|nr:GNAT family protein [Pseudomonas tolaasii]NVZ43886.1 GNAT family N-acetyltransferase [Pseudomonas tolaasii]NWA49212.1 GNAT family N-acetyltransferase [Pseudomonas tolaasii]